MRRPLDLAILDMLRGIGVVVLVAGVLMLAGWLVSVLVAVAFA